jgi:hypothetical protein
MTWFESWQDNNFSLGLCIHTISGTHPNSYGIDTEGAFPMNEMNAV